MLLFRCSLSAKKIELNSKELVSEDELVCLCVYDCVFNKACGYAIFFYLCKNISYYQSWVDYLQIVIRY